MNARQIVSGIIIALNILAVGAVGMAVVATPASSAEVCTTKDQIVEAAPKEMIERAGTIDDAGLAQAFGLLSGLPQAAQAVVDQYLVVALKNGNGEFVVTFPMSKGCGLLADGTNAPDWQKAIYRQWKPEQFSMALKRAAEEKDGI